MTVPNDSDAMTAAPASALPVDLDPVPVTPPAGSAYVLHDLAAVDAASEVQRWVWGLLYRDAVSCVSGEPGLGKSWFAVAAATTVLASGGNVVVVDYEDGPQTWASRLLALGAGEDALANVAYLRGGGAPTDADLGWLPRLVAALPDCLVVIDSMAEAMAAAGLDEDVAGDVTRWHQQVARPLADAGASVLILDHVTKHAKDRGRWARGSGAKLAAITGAAFSLVVEEPFSRERSGSGSLVIAKDRHGAIGAVGETAATLRFDVFDGGLRHIDVSPTVQRGHGEADPAPRIIPRPTLDLDEPF